MKILCIADPPLVSTHSCSIVMSNLAKQFVKLGHEIFYLGYGFSGQEFTHPDGYTVYPDKFPLTTKPSVLHYVDRFKIDVVILHGSKDVFKGAVDAGKERNIPVVCHTFFSTPSTTDKVTTFEAKNGFALQDCQNVSDLFVCNKFSVGVGFGLGKRSWYVGNGVDTEIFYPNDEYCCNAEYRNKLGIPNDAFVFLFSGTNMLGKDPGRTLEAFKRFYNKDTESRKNCYLVMHTQPETVYLNLPRIAEELGIKEHVKFFTDAFPEWKMPPEADKNYQKSAVSPPYLNTPYDLMGKVMRTGNVLIATTLLEGMSTTILEAMGCGLPVICSDDEVISEPVSNYSTGLLCRRHLTNECVTEDIIENMEKLFLDNDFYKELSRNAAEYIRIKHDWAVLAKQFIRHFEILISNYYK